MISDEGVTHACDTDDQLLLCDPGCHAQQYLVAGMKMVKGASHGDDGI